MAHSFEASAIAYSQTGRFSSIVNDYTDRPEKLKEFYAHSPTLEGINGAIKDRKGFNTDRTLLTEQLLKQYEGLGITDRLRKNIESLMSDNTFTICTAHQPNIFTGHLYFIYKIMHAIRLADELNEKIKDKKFVPVFFMGAEDADLEELGHIFIRGEKYEWKTKQKGAVGRMLIDDGLIDILRKISGQVRVLKNGETTISLLERCYVKGDTVQHATLKIVNELFGSYGLVVLMPDNAAFKQKMVEVFEDDIFNSRPSELVLSSSEKLSEQYKVQANPREINLFYLKDDIRNRIIKNGSSFQVVDTDLVFSSEELRKELNDHPEYFSPNVILRGLYQEMILPNVAFIGGGGELAYWFQLKGLFTAYKVPFPVLVLRNSFILINRDLAELINKTFPDKNDIFKTALQLMNDVVYRQSTNNLDLQPAIKSISAIYNNIESFADGVDSTLKPHVQRLNTAALKKLEQLQSKMLRAERKKFDVDQKRIQKLLKELFPNGGLQERVENFILFYGMWGDDLLLQLYKDSTGLEQKFVIISEK